MLIDEENTFVWPYEFTCTIVSEKVFIPNNYSLRLSIDPILPINENIGIGFKRIRHFMDNYLSNCLIINRESPYYEAIKDTDTPLTVLPCEPYDYYVGSFLLKKLLVITKNFFDISQITIDSAAGDRIQYTLWDPSDCGLDLSGDNWWNWDNLSTNNDVKITWKNLKHTMNRRFEPTVIKGGLSENK
jgi:hypothetical protein